jgi:hypothetical protein
MYGFGQPQWNDDDDDDDIQGDTDRQTDDLISLLSFLERRLKTVT